MALLCILYGQCRLVRGRPASFSTTLRWRIGSTCLLGSLCIHKGCWNALADIGDIKVARRPHKGSQRKQKKKKKGKKTERTGP